MIDKIARRTFLRISLTTCGGLTIGFPLEVEDRPTEKIDDFQINRFLKFRSNGTVQLFSGRSELGQGTNTNIKMMAAEELCIAPSQITLVVQSPKEGFYVGTGGSWGTATYYRSARPIFASARQAFINAASIKWQVDPEDCRVENGIICHRTLENKIAYHELFDLVSQVPIPSNAKAIAPEDFKYLGQSHSNEHLGNQLTGKAIYGIDVHVPDMLYASLERCLVAQGKLLNLDVDEARGMQDVVDVIPIRGSDWNDYNYYPSSIAILANDSWTAQEARKVIKVEWEYDQSLSINSEYIDKIFKDQLKQRGRQGYTKGDMNQCSYDADWTIEQIYETPFWSHSPMEPMNTVAHYREDGCEIWTPCHAQTRLFDAIKKITQFEDEQILIHTTLMGGSFGRRLLIDYAIEALLLSMHSGRPVQVLNSRIDETKCGHMMSASNYKVQAYFRNNLLSGVTFHTVGLSIYEQREREMLQAGIDGAWMDDLLRYPYTFPNARFEQSFTNDIKIPVLWWRGTFANTTGFVMESWIDEIATELKRDPLEFRISLLQDDSGVKRVDEEESLVDVAIMRNVLWAAGDYSKWTDKKPIGIGKGIANTYTFFESYAAIVAQVFVDRNGKVEVRRITCVIECGIVLNPDMVKAQIEGGIIFALSAMKSGIHYMNGMVEENSFRDYCILTYAECPQIDIHLLESERPVCGVGELSNIVTYAAVCNAIYDACGTRIRKLPLKNGFQL